MDPTGLARALVVLAPISRQHPWADHPKTPILGVVPASVKASRDPRPFQADLFGVAFRGNSPTPRSLVASNVQRATGSDRAHGPVGTPCGSDDRRRVGMRFQRGGRRPGGVRRRRAGPPQ